MHEQLLSVILVHIRKRRKRKYRFWEHNVMIKKQLQQGAYHNLIQVASCNILFCDTRWINLSYSALLRPLDSLAEFWRELIHALFSPLRESLPRAGRKKIKKSAPLPPAAPPPPRAYGIRPSHFPCFQFLPLQPPLPRRAYGFTALHDTICKSKKKKSMASLAVTKTPANFFMTSGV